MEVMIASVLFILAVILAYSLDHEDPEDAHDDETTETDWRWPRKRLGL